MSDERPHLTMAPSSDDETVVKALAYPFPRPNHSYLFIDGAAVQLTAWSPDFPSGGVLDSQGAPVSVRVYCERRGIDPGLLHRPRTPVLAYGSNASPLQLAHKYRDWPEPVVLPVIHGWLGNYDVVYAPLLAGYGSVPASLYPSPGTVAETFVTFLDEAQLAAMDRTESGYRRTEQAGAKIVLEDRLWLKPTVAYVAEPATLALDGAPVALREVAAANRRFPEMNQSAVLERVRTLLDFKGSVREFILAVTGQPRLREKYEETLRRDFSLPLP